MPMPHAATLYSLGSGSPLTPGWDTQWYCDGEVILKSSHIGQSTGCMSKQSNILSRVARPAHRTLAWGCAASGRAALSRRSCLELARTGT